MAEEKLNPTEEQPTEPTEATEEESRVVEKDGDVFVRMDTDEPDPETDPSVEGQSGEDNQQDQGTADKEPTGDDTNEDPYRGKSTDEVIQMHRDASRKISEQGNQISELKSSTKSTEQPSTEDLSADEILSRMTADQVESAYKAEKSKLTQMDQILDEAAYLQQQEMVIELEADWLKKRQDEQFNGRVNDAENNKFLADQKAKFKDIGIEMSDEEFDTVSEIAKVYTNNGKVDEKSVQKAMIDQYGVEKLVKFYAMNGEEKARKDIANATGKVENKIDVRGSGKNSKLVNIKNLSQREIRNLTKDMSVSELDELYQKLDI